MSKFEVTDAMVEAGIVAANYKCRCGDNQIDEYSAELLIYAAIKVSGLLEENARLRMENEQLNGAISWIQGDVY